MIELLNFKKVLNCHHRFSNLTVFIFFLEESFLHHIFGCYDDFEIPKCVSLVCKILIDIFSCIQQNSYFNQSPSGQSEYTVTGQ